MSATPSETCYVFVIQTDLYAGNFEREMCAFMTGCVGECSVGHELAALYAELNSVICKWDDLIYSIPDEHGCHRPASIWGNRINDVAIFFHEPGPNPNQCEFLIDRARLFAASQTRKERQPRIKGFELIHYRVQVNERKVRTWPGLAESHEDSWFDIGGEG